VCVGVTMSIVPSLAVLDMMKQNDYGVKLTDDIKTSVTLMAIVGAMFGQLVFGFCADQVGRKVRLRQ
jgi:MFS family permease